MRKSRFKEEQVVAIIRKYEAGAPMSELCRRIIIRCYFFELIMIR